MPIRIAFFFAPEYRVTLHTVNVVGIDTPSHCIFASTSPPKNVTGAAAPLPSTVPVVTVPDTMRPVLPAQTLLAQVLSKREDLGFQSVASETIKGGVSRSMSWNCWLRKTNVPAPHGEQAPFPWPVPLGQKQSVTRVLAFSEFLLEGHEVQAVFPGDCL